MLQVFFLTAVFFGYLLLPEFAAQAAGTKEFTPEREVIQINDQGIHPAVLTFENPDGTVFFYNATKDKPLLLAIDFGKRRLHCLGPDWQFGDDGILRSARPVAVRDFAITCFPEAGSYQVKVFGLRNGPESVTGTVIVSAAK